MLNMTLSMSFNVLVTLHTVILVTELLILAQVGFILLLKRPALAGHTGFQRLILIS